MWDKLEEKYIDELEKKIEAYLRFYSAEILKSPKGNKKSG
jgi:hypothetical protein